MKHHIQSIFGGIASSYHRNQEGSYLGSCAIDPDEKVNERLSGAIMPTNSEKVADLKDVLWFEGNDVNDDIYFYTAKGEFGRIYESDYGEAIEIITDKYYRVSAGGGKPTEDTMNNNRMAQPFRVSDEEVTGFSVYLSAIATNRTAVIELYKSEDNRPTGEPIIRKEVNLLSVEPRWIDVETSLDTNEDYMIVVFDKSREGIGFDGDINWHLLSKEGKSLTGKLGVTIDWIDQNGTFAFKVYAKETSCGNGLRHYNNYYYIASDKEIHRYGPMNDNPQMEYAWWGEQGVGPLGNCEGDVIGDLQIPNHQMYSHKDGALYVCDYNRVGGMHKVKTQDEIRFDRISEDFVIGEVVKGKNSGAMGVVTAVNLEEKAEIYKGNPSSHSVSGTGTVNWIDANKAYTEDGQVAKGDKLDQVEQCSTNWHHFGFNVPVYKTISGVEIRIKAMRNYDSGGSLSFNLSDGSIPISGAFRQIKPTTESLEWYSTGGKDDLIIPEDKLELTPQVVNNVGFGITRVEQTLRGSASGVAFYIGIDAIEIKVFTAGKGSLIVSPISGSFIEGEEITGITQGSGIATKVIQGGGTALIDKTSLHIGDNYKPITSSSYGDDIAILATKKNSSAKLLLWDAVSANTYKEVLLPYQRATALLNHLGSLIVFGGDNGYSLNYYIGGEALEQLSYIDNGTPPLQSSVKSIDSRIVWGSKRTYPYESGCLLAYGSKTGYGGLHNILITNNQISAVDRYVADSGGIYQRGGRYKSLWRSELLSFGKTFEINEITIPLGADLTKDDKIIVTLYYDNESRSTPYEIIEDTYRNRVITINPRREGVSNCFIEIEWDCKNQIPVTFPITIDYDV